MNFKDYLRAGNGAADITPLLGDGMAYKTLVQELSKLFGDIKIDKVACVEGRGFLLGAGVAMEMGVGIVPIRTAGKLKNETYSETYIDYSGKEKTLEIHRDGVTSDEHVLLVDDWVETGATNKAAIKLIERCGGKVVGVGAFMDDSSGELKNEMKGYNYKYLEKVEEGDKF